MRLALVLAVVVLLAGTSVLAADAFPISTKPPPPAGNGWRALYQRYPAPAELAHRVALAADQPAYEAIWTELGSPSRVLPPVDFAAQVVVMFATGTGSCTTGASLRTVVFDHDRRVVHADISERRRCGFLDLTGSAVFLVAIARDRLPEMPFELRLGRERLCADCPDGMTVDF